MVEKIHIHEDNCGMRNLFPLVVREEVAADLDEAAQASARNRDPSGAGWNDIYMIKSPATSYVEAGLLLAHAADALAPIMPRVRSFYATIGASIGRERGADPLGSYEDDAWCFGFGPHCYVKLDPEGDHVKYIWFDLESHAPEDVAALRAAFEAIDALVPSFVADYFRDVDVAVADAAGLNAYLTAFAEENRRCEVEFEAFVKQRGDEI